MRDNTDSLRDVKYYHLVKGCKKLHTRKGKHLRAVSAQLSVMRKKAGGGASIWRVCKTIALYFIKRGKMVTKTKVS